MEDNAWLQLTFEAFENTGYTIIHDERLQSLFSNFLESKGIEYNVEFEFEYITFRKVQ